MNAPNILLITADQQRADCLGVEGRRIKTPHLDQLARDGARFTQCITPTVVCQPARASILTGQLARTHGVHDNGIDLEPAIGERGFAAMLSRAGYATAFFGKAHFATYHTYQPTGTPECLKSSANYGADWFGPYMGFAHVEMMLVGHNWFPPQPPPHGQHYERWFYADGRGDAKMRLYRAEAGDAGETKGAAQTWHSRLPVAWHNTTWTAERAMAWLRRHARRSRSPSKSRSPASAQPFCAWVSFPDPHHPFDCPEPWSRLHHPRDVDLPRHRRRDFDKRPWWHEAAMTREPQGNRSSVNTRKNYSRIGEQTDAQLRQIIANYYGQIALIDHNVGRILQTLDECDLARDTWVIYTSDHGDWLGDHGLILKGPMHYEGLLRVPFLLRGPGVTAGRCIDAPVSTLDLCATFAELACATPLLTQHGRSLLPVLRGGGREFALNEWALLPARAGVALSLRTVRAGDSKLTVDMHSGDGELYDLARDPHEMRNLYNAPAAAKLRRDLERMLDSRPNDKRPLQPAVGMA